ncbi:hypothetical protein QR680_014556 [Steinernema hermaphroditum]|uniref:Uncharacterized protein n=1 Tax=Steinernema hermaphroditum TaxID=289476 RepID=A0AA39M3D8_9BILA|nr:hypothetical protein QR680_014556 [Steinernema hermaphroditum]
MRCVLFVFLCFVTAFTRACWPHRPSDKFEISAFGPGTGLLTSPTGFIAPTNDGRKQKLTQEKEIDKEVVVENKEFIGVEKEVEKHKVVNEEEPQPQGFKKNDKKLEPVEKKEKFKMEKDEDMEVIKEETDEKSTKDDKKLEEASYVTEHSKKETVGAENKKPPTEKPGCVCEKIKPAPSTKIGSKDRQSPEEEGPKIEKHKEANEEKPKPLGFKKNDEKLKPLEKKEKVKIDHKEDMQAIKERTDGKNNKDNKKLDEDSEEKAYTSTARTVVVTTEKSKDHSEEANRRDQNGDGSSKKTDKSGEKELPVPTDGDVDGSGDTDEEDDDVVKDDEYKLKVTTAGGCPDGYLGLENGAAVIGLLQLTDGKVSKYAEKQFRKKERMWSPSWSALNSKVPHGYCDDPASFCQKLDKILYWFDSDSVHFAKEISVKYLTKTHVFQLKKGINDDDCCGSLSHNWFGDHEDRRCADYFGKSQRIGANYPQSGYYLIDRDVGVEGILNEEDKVKFTKGEMTIGQLQKPCTHVCRDYSKLTFG